MSDEDQKPIGTEESSTAAAADELKKNDLMGDDNETSDEPSIADAQLAKKKVEESIEDLDELVEQDASSEESSEASLEDMDAQLQKEAPELAAELENIKAGDFSAVNDSDVKSEKGAKVKAIIAAVVGILTFKFLKMMPREQKIKAFLILLLVGVAIPVFLLAVSGRLLPSYKTPYRLNFGEMTKKMATYDASMSMIPLFDSLRSKAVTVVMPQIVINLRSVQGSASFGRFTFSISVRDKEFAKMIEDQKGTIVDMIQRTLEQVSWEDIQNPMGKEKVKKILRYKLNEFFQSDVILGVYYESIILTR